MLTEALVSYLRNAPEDKGLHNWLKLTEVHDAYCQLAEEHILQIEPYDTGNGRGIVTSGGGIKYFPSLYVLCYQLRRICCKLPIEIWHFGPSEFDPKMKEILAPFNVSFRDVTEEIQLCPVRIVGGWQLKPYCMMRSAFKEVLWIDADNAPVRDPEPLFSERKYLKTGVVFWPDFMHWIQHPLNGEMMVNWVYKGFGLELPKETRPAGNDYEWFGKKTPENEWFDICFESGQMMIDKERNWKALALAHWYCQHSEFYFRLVHGDKETFHFAWRKLQQPYTLAPTMPDYEVHTTVQYDFDGKPLFEHRNRPDAKWRLDRNISSNTKKLQIEPTGIWLMTELEKQWSGVLWQNSAMNEQERAIAESLTSQLWNYYRIGLDSRILEFLPDGTIGRGKQLCEQRWSVYSTNGKPVLVVSGEKPTCFLEQAEEGCWVGQWLEYEKCEVQLEPVKIRKKVKL